MVCEPVCRIGFSCLLKTRFCRCLPVCVVPERFCVVLYPPLLLARGCMLFYHGCLLMTLKERTIMWLYEINLYWKQQIKIQKRKKPFRLLPVLFSIAVALLLLCALVLHGCVLMKENKGRIMLDQLRQTILIKNKRNDTWLPINLTGAPPFCDSLPLFI